MTEDQERRKPVCYLVCFSEPYTARTGQQKKQARHYLGWTVNLDKRIQLHRANQGARLLAVINAAGIGWAVVRIWDNGSRALELKLKSRHRHADLCPVCQERRQQERRRYQGERQHAQEDSILKEGSAKAGPFAFYAPAAAGEPPR